MKKSKKLSEIKACPYCGSDNIVFNKDKDEVICKDCREIITKV